MTAIGATSYYSNGARNTGTGKSNAANAADAFTNQQEAETGTGHTTSAGPYASQATVDSGPSPVTLRLQGQIVTAIKLDTSNMKAINISQLPEDEYQSFREMDERLMEANKRYLESQYTRRPEFPDLSDYPGNKSYATVVVGGKVVARIDNQGVVESDNTLGARFRDILPGSVNRTNGPDLAQARAEQIAAMLGGRVVKASTAMTQSQFNALPPIELPKATIDYEAMQKDPMYERLQNMQQQLEKTKQVRAEYLAQQQAGVDIRN